MREPFIVRKQLAPLHGPVRCQHWHCSDRYGRQHRHHLSEPCILCQNERYIKKLECRRVERAMRWQLTRSGR